MIKVGDRVLHIRTHGSYSKQVSVIEVTGETPKFWKCDDSYFSKEAPYRLRGNNDPHYHNYIKEPTYYTVLKLEDSDGFVAKTVPSFDLKSVEGVLAYYLYTYNDEDIKVILKASGTREECDTLTNTLNESSERKSW